MNGIQIHDLCDTSAVLYQLSYQTIWELVTLVVCNIPGDGEYTCIIEYMKDHIFQLQLCTQLKQFKRIVSHVFTCILHHLRVHYELTK